MNLNDFFVRSDLCNLLMACGHILIEAGEEFRDPATTETRKCVLRGTIKKWQEVHDKVSACIDALDNQ